MIVLILFGIVGYLFFKYLLPMLRSDDPEKKPKELYRFYGNHPKLFVLTVMFAVFGIGQFIVEAILTMIGFIFVPCYNDGDGGMISIMCEIKKGLGLVG
jgi:hypothetical protein